MLPTLPAALPADAVLELQRTAGNRAVGALLARAGGGGAATQGVAPPKRGSLLAAIGGNLSVLRQLLALLGDQPYRLWQLMDDLGTQDGEAILPLLQAVAGNADWLVRLVGPVVAKGGTLGTVGRLLREEDDVNVLLDLVAQASALDRLPPLIRLVADPPLTLRMLEHEPDPAALLDLCRNLTDDLGLVPYLLRLIGTGLLGQLAAHEGHVEVLVPLVESATDRSQLAGLLQAVRDRSLLLQLVKLEPSSALLLPVCGLVADLATLPALLPLVADRALLVQLLRREQDATVLAGLVPAIEDLPALPRLLESIPGRPLLSECLKLERSGARLVPICTAMKDHAPLPKLLTAVPDRTVLAAIVEREPDGAEALKLVAACADPTPLPRLLELCPDRALLAGVLKDAKRDGAGLVPVFEVVTEQSALPALLRSFEKDRGLLVELARFEPSSVELQKLVKAASFSHAGSLLGLLQTVHDRTLVVALAPLLKSHDPGQLVAACGQIDVPGRLPELLKTRMAGKLSDLLDLLAVERKAEVLLAIAKSVNTAPAALELLKLDDDRPRLLSNLVREPDRTKLRPVYDAVGTARTLVGPLLDRCKDRAGLMTMLRLAAHPAALVRLVEGVALTHKALVPLLECEADADRLLACLQVEKDPDKLLSVYKRVRRADELLTLISKVEHYALWELLGVEGDTVALKALIADAGMAPKELAKLIRAVPDRGQLDRALKAGYKGDLVQLVSSLKDTSRIGELLELGIDRSNLLDLVAKEPDSTRLVELLGHVPKAADLVGLLQRLGKAPSVILLNCLRLEKDLTTIRAALGLDDLHEAEPLLKAIPDRTIFRALVAAERRQGVLRKVLASIPDPAVALRFLGLLSEGMRPRVGEFTALVPDLTELEALLNLYGGAMDRERLLRLLAALVHDGVAGAEMVTLLTGMAGAMAEDAVETAITRMRGNLKTTTTGASATPITAAGGKKALLGTEIAEHAAHTTAMGRGLADIAGRYPTGQDPTTRTDHQLWTDCSPTAITHVDVTQAGHQETPAQKVIRQKMALRTLMEKYPARAELVRKIFLHDDGQTPRPFVSAATEDTYAVGAHTVDRHVLNGSGTIPDIDAVATRACLKQPHCGAIASAFNSLVDANTAISTAVTATVVANWAAYRDQIVQTGVLAPVSSACAANLGVCLKKRDQPRDAAYSNADMTSGRPLLLGGAGAGQSLTYPVALGQIELSLAVSDHANAHGWSVYTSWPKP